MSYDVQSVCDILGISALQAQVLVEAHTGNIDRAVCAYLDKTIVLGDDHIPESLVPLQQLRLANVADATIVSPDEAKDARTSAGDVGDCNVIAANPETVNRDTTQHSAPNPNTYSCKPPEVNAQSAGVTNLKESHANVFDHIVPQTGTTEHIETSGDCSRTHTGELDTSDDKHVDPSIFADPQDPELDLDYPCSADTKLDSDAAIANTVGKDVLDTHLHSERNRLMDEHASLQCRMASDNLQKSVMTTPMVKSLDRSTGSKPTRNLFSDTPSNKRKRRQASMDEFSNSSHALARKRPTLAEVASQFCMPRIRMKKGFDTYEVFKGNKMVNIPLREFTRRTPTSAVEGLLPQEMAAHLLTLIRDDSITWTRHTRVVFNRTVESPRVTNLYRLSVLGEANACTTIAHAELHLYNKQPITDMEREKKIQRLLNTAAAIVGQKVDALQRTRRPPDVEPLPPWKPTLVIINVYRNGQDATGRHSDTLNVLGPRALIGSVSLGAERLFTLDKVSKTTNQNELAWDESTKTNVNEKFAVRLRHNSLLVMWEGCQEAWKHEVPKESHYTSHKISGALRVNLTFRRHDPEYVRKQPICCGVKRTLRTIFKDGPNHGRYFWMCSMCPKTLWDDHVL